MKLNFFIDGSEIAFAFDSISKDLAPVLTNTVKEVGSYMVEKAKATTKFNHSAAFDSGIQFNMDNDKSGHLTSKTYSYNRTEYSNFLEFGNLPVDNKKMTFKIDGKWITTYHRKAIGQEHLGFITDAKEQTEQHLESIFIAEFDKIFS
jgi:hypothetical protein